MVLHGLSVGWQEGGLNEVRPRRPEQFRVTVVAVSAADAVSMKSGLEGRNNKGVRGC
mgnify:CR=1 FL=1